MITGSIIFDILLFIGIGIVLIVIIWMVKFVNYAAKMKKHNSYLNSKNNPK